MGLGPAQHPVTAQELIRRPEISYRSFLEWEGRPLPDLPPGTLNELESRIKYAGYITKQEQAVERTARLHDKKIPPDFDYHKANNLSREARQKLAELRPATIGQASRMEGVTPADISVLLLYLERPGAMSKKKETAAEGIADHDRPS